MEKTGVMYEKFLDEYVSESAVRKYTTRTAGYGISYLLSHDYARVYLNGVKACLPPAQGKALRLLEFGCGGGMNITRLVSLLEQKQIPVEVAYGADFSPRLIEAAREEARTYLPPSLAAKLSFCVARNEELERDLVTGMGGNDSQVGAFDMIVGVNTFRYCHRIDKQVHCANDIFRLLSPGGVCVNIDMNDRFPAFRSRLRRQDSKSKECYVPSLAEYVSPFKTAGFEILAEKNFCWVPHSAGRSLTLACRMAAPFLSVVAPSRAMRSLVIARKPV